MANLSSFGTRNTANSGVVIEIPDPSTGAPTGFKVKILGKDSDAYRKVESEQRERAIRAANTTGTFRVSPEVIENNALELILASVIGWEGLEDENGPVPFSREKLRETLVEYPYLREVLDRNIADRSLFAGR